MNRQAGDRIPTTFDDSRVMREPARAVKKEDESTMTTLIRTLAAGILGLACLLGPFAGAARAAAIGSAFTYQGSLSDNGSAPTGLYDFRCTLWDAAGGGSQSGSTLTLDDRQVTTGVFTLDLDFGSAAYAGDARWLQVEVRQGASTGAYTTLTRQRLNPTPFTLGLSLPHSQTFSSASPLIQLHNTGAGHGASFQAGGVATNYGVVGSNSSTGSQAAGVYGVETGTSGLTIGVLGVATASSSGTGLVGTGTSTGAYITGTGSSSTGVYAYGKSRALYAENTATGPAISARGSGIDTANAVIIADNVGQGTSFYGISNGPTRTRATVRLNNTHADGMCEWALNGSTQATAHFQNDGSGQVLWLQKDSPGNFIQAYGSGETKFWVDQAGVTHTKVLEILGGADLSEKFEVGEADAAIEPGTVVSIDPAHEGRLEVAATPYDHRVAGVISGAGGVRPGMLMGQDGTVASGRHPVALSGRVYCRATVANGPIAPGDLLTTSSVPGYCMRVGDPARAQGAIIGKAMGSLDRGEGLILVLVGLQ
jgi:hypothetical protein